MLPIAMVGHRCTLHRDVGTSELYSYCFCAALMSTCCNKNAADLASESGQASITKFITKYKADANIRLTTLNTAQYGADEGGKDEEKASLHAAWKRGTLTL